MVVILLALILLVLVLALIPWPISIPLLLIVGAVWLLRAAANRWGDYWTARRRERNAREREMRGRTRGEFVGWLAVGLIAWGGMQATTLAAQPKSGLFARYVTQGAILRFNSYDWRLHVTDEFGHDYDFRVVGPDAKTSVGMPVGGAEAGLLLGSVYLSGRGVLDGTELGIGWVYSTEPIVLRADPHSAAMPEELRTGRVLLDASLRLASVPVSAGEDYVRPAYAGDPGMFIVDPQTGERHIFDVGSKIRALREATYSAAEFRASWLMLHIVELGGFVGYRTPANVSFAWTGREFLDKKDIPIPGETSGTAPTASLGGFYWGASVGLLLASF